MLTWLGIWSQPAGVATWDNKLRPHRDFSIKLAEDSVAVISLQLVSVTRLSNASTKCTCSWKSNVSPVTLPFDIGENLRPRLSPGTTGPALRPRGAWPSPEQSWQKMFGLAVRPQSSMAGRAAR
eukprot:219276-Rhodomonas_salina.2